MNAIFRRVYNALAHFPDGATILELCEATSLFAADVAGSLDGLIARGWAVKSGELYFQRSPKVASVDAVITKHLTDLGND